MQNMKLTRVSLSLYWSLCDCNMLIICTLIWLFALLLFVLSAVLLPLVVSSTPNRAAKSNVPFTSALLPLLLRVPPEPEDLVRLTPAAADTLASRAAVRISNSASNLITTVKITLKNRYNN